MDLSHSNVAELCATIDLNCENPIIDLSNITFFQPFALVYLGMFLRYHNSQGKCCKVTLPNTLNARGYLARQNFWERFNFTDEAISQESLHRFSTSSSLNDIVDVTKEPDVADDIARKIANVLSRNRVKVKIGLVAEVVSELVDNFALHSDQTLAAVAMQYYPNWHRIKFAVGDCGVGIRHTLSRNPRFANFDELPHYEAALKAFDPLVSRFSEGGMGLTEVREQVMNLRGRLMLSTGDGYVAISQGNMVYGNMEHDLTGVQIELTFPEEK